MGFDIQGFIAKVEKFVNDNKPERQGKTGDGQFDAYEKASLFNNKELLNELKTACEEDQSVQKQVQNDLGLSLSSIKSRIEELGTKNTRRAGGGDDGGDGGDGGNGGNGGNGGVAGGINIFINNSVNINIEINISTEIKNEINNNLSCGCGGPGGADIDALVEILKKLLGEGGTIQEFILYIFNQFSEKLGLDLGNIQELLKQILSKLDSQEQTINKMNEYLVELMKQNYNALAMMGLKMDTLIEIVQKGNADNIEILGKIYTAIMDLTGQFNDFTQVEKDQFNQIMEMLKNGNVNLEQVLALLNAIKNDTSENNHISQNILKAIVEGKKEILNALTKIDKDFNQFGDDIKAKLTEILNKIAIGGGTGGGDVTVNVNLDKVLDTLKAMLEKLNSIEQNTAETKEISKKILEVIDKFGVSIVNSLSTIINSMGNDSAKLDKLIAFLEKMDSNNQERVNKLLDAIAKIAITGGGGGDVSVTFDVDSIIDAINKAGGDMNAKMDEIIKLLNTINNNVVQGNEDAKKLAQDIIDAINKLGFDVAGSLTTIIENMNGDAAKMEELLAFLKTMDANNETRNKAILDAIAKLGVDVITALNNLDVQVTVEGGGTSGPVDLSTVIDAINSVGGDINKSLGDIFELLKTLNGNVVQGNINNQEMAQLILAALANIETAVNAKGDKLNLDEVIALLQQILEAIKNHEVTITIENDGTCHCKCTEGSTHEGEQDDWGSILSAPRRSISHDTTGINNVSNSSDDSQGGVTINGKYLKPGKYTGQALGLGSGVYIVKNGKVFDLSGKEVNF